MNNATVYVIDDDPAVRESLTLLLEQEGASIETFADGKDFLSACHSLAPRSCAIIDIQMPEMDGLALQAELVRQNIRVPVIFLTGHGDIPMSVRAIKNGAINFLTKPITGTDLIESVKAALEESEKLIGESELISSATRRLSSLTHREHEVMTQAIAGRTNKEIAKQLGISHRTVEIHKARVMQKTGATTLLELSLLVKTADFHSS